MRYLPDDNLSYPILIKLGNSSGSGFILNFEMCMYLVTARHVLLKKKPQDADFTLVSPAAEIVCYARDLTVAEPLIYKLNLDLLKEQGMVKLHSVHDVAIVKIANLEKVERPITGRDFSVFFLKEVTYVSGPSGQSLVGIPQKSFKTYKDVMVSNEVVVFGYPNSLGVESSGQIDQMRPLLRKGIVAGKNTKNKTIVLDCPVYFGNSGGLVVEIEDMQDGSRRAHCIGIVSEYVPFVERLLSIQHGTINTNIENSGYSIAVPIDAILELLEK